MVGVKQSINQDQKQKQEAQQCPKDEEQLSSIKSQVIAQDEAPMSELSVANQDTLTSTLVDDAPHLLHGWEGSGPPLGELLHGDAPAESRLPLR